MREGRTITECGAGENGRNARNKGEDEELQRPGFILFRKLYHFFFELLKNPFGFIEKTTWTVLTK